MIRTKKKYQKPFVQLLMIISKKTRNSKRNRTTNKRQGRLSRTNPKPSDYFVFKGTPCAANFKGGDLIFLKHAINGAWRDLEISRHFFRRHDFVHIGHSFEIRHNRNLVNFSQFSKMQTDMTRSFDSYFNAQRHIYVRMLDAGYSPFCATGGDSSLTIG